MGEKPTYTPEDALAQPESLLTPERQEIKKGLENLGLLQNLVVLAKRGMELAKKALTK